ncbi:DUF547 domain-containing protein [Candidatus Riflebacteria bacterium]
MKKEKMKNRLYFCVPLFLFLLSFIPLSKVEAGESHENLQRQQILKHEIFDRILREFVNEQGLVDYAGLKKEVRRLESYIMQLRSIKDPETLPRNDRLSFWINAYNALTLCLILDYYPKIRSIKDIPRRKRWWHNRFKLGRKIYSLDHIEHQILRKMEEPGIHFAIVCASIGCPKLQKRAFTGENIEAQLEKAKIDFFNSPNQVKIGDEKGIIWGTNRVVKVSQIFNWFGRDFKKDGKSVLSYIYKNANLEQKKYMDRFEKELALKFLHWDWKLNDWKRKK